MRLYLLVIFLFTISIIKAESVRQILRNIFIDAVDINYNLFSKNTINTLVAMAPFYILARQEDNRLHGYFYDYKRHKNKHALPRWADTLSSVITASLIVGDIGVIALGPNPRARATATIFAIGLPFANVLKDGFKKIKSNFCLRPKNEYFDRYKKTYGGFPSGHMMIAAYMTTIYGSEFGPKAGIPLGIASTYIFTEYISSNRHFASQLVAGTALGIIYGLASTKVVDDRMNRFLNHCSISMNDTYNPAVQFFYDF